MDYIDEEAVSEDFDCPLCKRGTVMVRRRHVINRKWIAECNHCGIQGEFWDPFEPQDYFNELARYFEKELDEIDRK